MQNLPAPTDIDILGQNPSFFTLLQVQGRAPEAQKLAQGPQVALQGTEALRIGLWCLHFTYTCLFLIVLVIEGQLSGVSSLLQSCEFRARDPVLKAAPGLCFVLLLFFTP